MQDNIFIFRWIIRILKLAVMVCKFTGLYISVLTMIVLGIIESKFHIRSGSIAGHIEMIILYLSFIPVPFITIQNVVRMVKTDFSLKEFIYKVLNKRQRETFENIDKSLVGLESGIVLGKTKNTYLVMEEHSEGHIMVVGGQGSGKSSSVAIPTLLNYNSSIFAIDIKGELSETCKNYRKKDIQPIK